jgi:hypothetical protein
LERLPLAYCGYYRLQENLDIVCNVLEKHWRISELCFIRESPH